MIWQKQGLVLLPRVVGDWSATHAALPHLGPEEPGVERWLYFSARDPQGRSHIARARVDLDDLVRMPRWDTEPVLAPGPRGAFDESGVTASCLVEWQGIQYLYYSGWSLGTSVPFYFYAGCAVSSDGGQSFDRVSAAPILERTNTDPYLTASPYVLVEEGHWRMWYVSGTGWSIVDGVVQPHYLIRYAESDDGIEWRRDGTVCLDFELGEHAIARPCVIRRNDEYQMWFASRGTKYRIGFATSVDGVAWHRQSSHVGIDVAPSGWDAEMIEYPWVYEHQGYLHMLYNGNGYGATGIGHAIQSQGSFDA